MRDIACSIILCCVLITDTFNAPLGKKRAWIPDEKEAYVEAEIKGLDGDKLLVETKDGRVRGTSYLPYALFFPRYLFNLIEGVYNLFNFN